MCLSKSFDAEKGMALYLINDYVLAWNPEIAVKRRFHLSMIWDNHAALLS